MKHLSFLIIILLVSCSKSPRTIEGDHQLGGMIGNGLTYVHFHWKYQLFRDGDFTDLTETGLDVMITDAPQAVSEDAISSMFITAPEEYQGKGINTPEGLIRQLLHNPQHAGKNWNLVSLNNLEGWKSITEMREEYLLLLPHSTKIGEFHVIYIDVNLADTETSQYIRSIIDTFDKEAPKIIKWEMVVFHGGISASKFNMDLAHEITSDGQLIEPRNSNHRIWVYFNQMVEPASLSELVKFSSLPSSSAEGVHANVVGDWFEDGVHKVELELNTLGFDSGAYCVRIANVTNHLGISLENNDNSYRKFTVLKGDVTGDRVVNDDDVDEEVRCFLASGGGDPRNCGDPIRYDLNADAFINFTDIGKAVDGVRDAPTVPSTELVSCPGLDQFELH